MNLLAGPSTSLPNPGEGEQTSPPPALRVSDDRPAVAAVATKVRDGRNGWDVASWAGSLLVVAGTAWWALGVPLRELPQQQTVAAHGRAEALVAEPGGLQVPRLPLPASESSLDLAAFRTPLWVAPPAPPPPLPPPAAAKPSPEPPAPALKWQLLAIIQTGGGGSAATKVMLYDPDTGAVIELQQQQQHGGKVIERIENGHVTIRQGRHIHVLSLENPVSGGGGSRAR